MQIELSEPSRNAAAEAEAAISACDWLGLRGKSALVTGGGSGIGLAIARAFLDMGVSVELLDRIDMPEDLAGADSARMHLADVRERGSLDRVRDQLQEEGRKIDILVANAGVNVRKPLLELSPDEISAIIDTNFTGVINTLQAFAPLQQGSTAPAVIVTSSVAAIHGMNLRSVYSATKAALSGLVRAAAIEWGPAGVRVNAVGPGIIRTPLTSAYMEQFPQKAESACAEVPLRRIGIPEEVADVVLFLAGTPSRFMTGQTVIVDGGLMAGSSWW